MGTVTENKKTIKKFKDLNSFVLETMIERDPEIYSAVAKVLDSIERKYFYSSETEAKEWTLDDFKNTKIIVDTPEKSIRLQGLLLDLGAEWGSDDVREEYKRKLVNHTNQKYLVINDQGIIYYLEQKHNWASSGKEEKFYYDIFPEETQTKQWTLDDFKNTKIIVDTPGKSQRFQELLFSLGSKWGGSVFESEDARKEVKHTNQKYLGIRDIGTLFYFTNEKEYKTYEDQPGIEMKEIFYDDIFPPLITTEEKEAKELTLDDFKGTRILVSSEEKSRRFQELIFSLGGKWASGENKTPILLDVEFLIVDKQGDIGYTDATDFADSDYKQIFYANIFPKEHEKRVSTTYISLKDFYKTKIEVNEKQSILLQEYLFSLGAKWFTGDRDLKWFNEKYLVIDQEGILTPVTKYNFDANPTYKSEYKRIYYSDIFRTDIERAFKDEPLEADFLTWPKPEIAKIYRIDKNKGDRKSPTQSAGELKDLFSDDESKTELFATYFRGNDGNWYRLYEDKNGTWRWSKQATPKQLK
jgi:hypothetical protein